MTNTDFPQIPVNPQPERHSVFAYCADGSRYRVKSDDLTYTRALEVFGPEDNRLRNATEPVRINGSQIQYFNVRSMDDPDWNTSPVGTVVWGFQADDYGKMPMFTIRVNNMVKKLKGTMRDAMESAAFTDRLSYDTHAKTKEGLVNRDMVATRYGGTLTQFGIAVAHQVFLAERGVTVEQFHAKRRNEQRAATLKHAAKTAAYKRRVNALSPALAGLSFQGKPAADMLVSDDYQRPMYKHSPTFGNGKIEMTFDELEALVAKLSQAR